jgi:hypothetical protein
MIVRAPLDAFCSDAFTVSGVNKDISPLARVSPFRVILISSLNPVNVASDRIHLARVMPALDNPDKLVSSALSAGLFLP